MSWIYGTPSYCWYARHEHCLMGESSTDHYSTTKKLPESLFSTRHDSPDELKRGSFHLLPNYGTILPSARATFCHCQAQSNTPGEKFREVYHRQSEYAFRLLEAWFCPGKTLLSILLFTLHSPKQLYISCLWSIREE